MRKTLGAIANNQTDLYKMMRKKATTYNIGDMKTWQDSKQHQSLSDRGGVS